MKKAFLVFVLSALSIPSLADFSHYYVTLVNKYWDNNSSLVLESFTPKQYPKDYCPQPPPGIPPSPPWFIYGGPYCNPSAQQPRVSETVPTVTYTLNGSNGAKILTCEVTYSYISGVCSATVTSSHEWQPGVAKCWASSNYSENTGVCAVTFTFTPAVARKGG